MTNEQTQPEATPTAKTTSPLNTFLKHQQSAFEETGKAFASLLPTEFREHTKNALEENKASFGVLWDGLIDGIEKGLDKMRVKGEPAGPQNKVKIDVE